MYASPGELAALEIQGEWTMRNLIRTGLKPTGCHGKGRHGKGLRGTASAVAIAIAATGVAIQPTPAEAQSLLDRLFNPKYRQMKELKARQELERQKVTRIKVSAPKIYTYKPDVWKTVKLSSLAVVKTAAVETPADGAATADGEAPTVVPVPVLTEFDKARPVLKNLKIKALPEVGEAVLAYYREHPDFIWVADNRPTVKAAKIRRTIASAADDGLDPADYFVPLPKTAGLDGEALQKEVMAFEMAMTVNALTYALDANRGRIDPNRLSGYHDLPRHDVDLVALLRDLEASGKPGDILLAQHPGSDQYKAFRAELAALREADEKDRIAIAPGTFLKPGRTSPQMANIVAAIRLNGSDGLKETHTETLSAYDGGETYTPELVALVKAYQKESKLSADGIVGKNTIRALVGVTNADKIAKVKLAMERSRWLPHELGERRVFINQPAFTATYREPGKDPLSMRVVVGKRSNQTNFFYDEIEVVEYNPYWGVPYSIIVNEMMPKLAKDPTYLDRSGYEVTTVSGRKVSSASVDWYSVATKKSSINVRQYPGRSNALGEVKILFPNKHAIYMHDTPAKKLFSKDVRAFSHGCVRLHDPKAMAAAVLGKSKDYVTGRIAAGKNEQEKVEGNIPVYVSYFTAWPKDDGSMGYYSDVYDRDRRALTAITATTKSRQAARS